MDLKYIMLKDRYRFAYIPQIALYNLDDNIKREKEISLYIKELTLYKIPFKLLSKNRPNSKVKDEILNIAYACIEETAIFNKLTSKRVLPLKQVSEFTYKSKGFIEKWQYYIVAYMLLLSKDVYRHLQAYLNIELVDRENGSKANSLAVISGTSSKGNTYTGVVLKRIKNTAVILTPFGDFVKIKPNENSLLQPGCTCTGNLKRDINFYKYPIIAILFFSIILVAASAFIYFRPFRTVLVQANSTVKLEINAWNRVVKVTPLSTYGNRIVESIDLINVSMDRGIYMILKEGKDKNIIEDNTKVTIFITGTKKLHTSLPETESYILETNLNIQINNNGIEYKFQNTVPTDIK